MTMMLMMDKMPKEPMTTMMPMEYGQQEQGQQQHETTIQHDNKKGSRWGGGHQ